MMQIHTCRIDSLWVASLLGTSFEARNISRDEAITMLRDMVVRALSQSCAIARARTENK